LRTTGQWRFNACTRRRNPGTSINHFASEAVAMSKGLNQKKDTKKKPAKNLKEKRAEKEAKRQSRG
jgi:hypothetical protein